MKKNKAIKRLTIASLCVGVAISACSGIALLDKKEAVAVGLTDVNYFSLIKANNPYATVTYENGIRLSSDVGYETTLDYTFKNDTTLKFTFPETLDPNNKWWGGDFTVRVTDVRDESNYFDVVYFESKAIKDENNPTGYSNCATGIVVEYKGLVRSLNNAQNGIETTRSSSVLLCAPTFLSNYGGGNGSEASRKRVGELAFVWDENDVLSISNNHLTINKLRTVAKFDGTDAVSGTTAFGLPKLSFKDGYKISFLSNFDKEDVNDHATDVCLKEIITDDTTVAYSELCNNQEPITLPARVQGGEYANVEVGDELTIPVAIDIDGLEVQDVQVIRPNGKAQLVEPGEIYKVKYKGLYTITYTLTHATGDTKESMVAFSFMSGSDWIASTDFVHTAANVTRSVDGLRISSDEPYNATFKGVFTGDTTLKFKFPETYQNAYYGDFTFRITDAMDDSNYFDIKYYVANGNTANYTGVYVKYQDEVRLANATENAWYDAIQNDSDAVAYAPSFLSYCGNGNDQIYDGDRMGVLSLVWSDDVLAVQANSAVHSDEADMRTVAMFDGTNGFVDQESWGLPKMHFANGYMVSVSSSFEDFATKDKGTDVLFSSIENGDVIYDFSKTKFEKDDNVKSFVGNFKTLTKVQTAGKAFLGWKATDGKLYPAYSIVRKQTGVSYEAVVLGFDTVNGASLRIDASEDGRSGMRFQTLFDVDEYAKIKDLDYIQSFGTLIAWTDTLTTVNKDFTIENYQGEFAFAKVENTKGTFEYTNQNGKKYTAYSMAIDVNPENYAKQYSARGYLVVVYADGSTQTIYTDYNAMDNSRSIAETAILFKTIDTATYEAMTDEQKAVIDRYADAYVMILN